MCRPLAATHVGAARADPWTPSTPFHAHSRFAATLTRSRRKSPQCAPCTRTPCRSPPSRTWIAPPQVHIDWSFPCISKLPPAPEPSPTGAASASPWPTTSCNRLILFKTRSLQLLITLPVLKFRHLCIVPMHQRPNSDHREGRTNGRTRKQTLQGSGIAVTRVHELEFPARRVREGHADGWKRGETTSSDE